MAVNRKVVIPDHSLPKAPPIQYLTENGFSIVRLSDIDPSAINSPRECRFLVQGEHDVKREIRVSCSEELITDIRIRRRGKLSDQSQFWLVCSESCLANYLWEKNDYPPNDQLTINELPPDELMLAIHWKDKESNQDVF
jgi:hypothetical protein